MTKLRLWIVFLLLAVVSALVPAHAGAIFEAATPSAIVISSIAYVNVVTTTTRVGGFTSALIKSPSSNITLADVFGHVGSCVSTAVSTTTIKGPIEIQRADETTEIELADDQCLWLVSNSTQTIFVQPIRRKK